MTNFLEIILESILNEGRTKSVIEKWSNYVIPKLGTPMKNNEEWDYVIKTATSPQNDPSGSNKYLDWILARLIDYINYGINERNEPPSIIGELDFLLETVDDFHRFSERNLIKNKDIYSPEYKDLDKINDVIRDAARKSQELFKERELKAGADKVYQDSRWSVIVPKTHEASCHYGAGTKWCTTMKNSPNYFQTYTTNGVLFYVLDKTRKEGTLYKFAIHYRFSPGRVAHVPFQGEWVAYTPFDSGGMVGYDEQDNEINLDYILPLLPKEMIDVIHGYFFTKLNKLNEVKKNEAIQKVIQEKEAVKTNNSRIRELYDTLLTSLIRVGFYEVFTDTFEEHTVDNQKFREFYGSPWRYVTFQDDGRFQIYLDASYPSDEEESLYFVEGIFSITEGIKCRVYKSREDAPFGDVENADPIGEGVEIGLARIENAFFTFTKTVLIALRETKNLTLGSLYMENEWVVQDIVDSMLDNKGNEIIESLLNTFDSIMNIIILPLFVKNSVPTKNNFIVWKPMASHSSYKFEYPPQQNSLTQRFLTYIMENPGRTAEQFYRDVLGQTRRPSHNSTFFSSIKDAGLVRMERRGRQFVYFIGPNYEAWTQNRLRRY